jgi:HAD superfamily hydrolase (TIGR01509 family)
MTSDKLDVKGILFDLDGTILDTKPAYLETAKIAFEATGQERPEKAVALEIPKRIEQRKLIDDIVKVDTKAFLNVYLQTFYKISSSNTKPFPNVDSTLEKLAQKAKLAVITMRFVHRDVIIHELEQFRLSHYFMHILTALDTKPKPSPEALFAAVTAMSLQMRDCIIVGDSVIDVKAGKAAGAKTVAVLTGLYSQTELLNAEPDFVINDVSELCNIIN